jgi:hypothetical protein
MFDPISMIAGIGTSAVGTGIGSLFGGGAPEYQPSPVMEEMGDYALEQIKASPSQKKAIKSQFKALKKSGNRGAAEAFLESYRDRFSNPAFIDKKLAKSYGKEVDYKSDPFQSAAQEVYGQQGLGYTGEDFETFIQRAKGKNIRSPQAFGDMLKQDLIAAGKVMTPQQEALSYIYGTPFKTAEGVYTNTYQPLAKPEPYDISKLPFLPSSFGA